MPGRGNHPDEPWLLPPDILLLLVSGSFNYSLITPGLMLISQPLGAYVPSQFTLTPAPHYRNRYLLWSKLVAFDLILTQLHNFLSYILHYFSSSCHEMSNGSKLEEGRFIFGSRFQGTSVLHGRKGMVMGVAQSLVGSLKNGLFTFRKIKKQRAGLKVGTHVIQTLATCMHQLDSMYQSWPGTQMHECVWEMLTSKP